MNTLQKTVLTLLNQQNQAQRRKQERLKPNNRRMVKKIPRLLISNPSLRLLDYKVLKVFFCDNKLPCPITVLTLIGKNNNNKKTTKQTNKNPPSRNKLWKCTGKIQQHFSPSSQSKCLIWFSLQQDCAVFFCIIVCTTTITQSGMWIDCAQANLLLRNMCSVYYEFHAFLWLAKCIFSQTAVLFDTVLLFG